MSEISSEAKKAGVLEPEKPVSEMTEEELIGKLEMIQRMKSESNILELKSAEKGCPQHLYDSLSSFSNQDEGGIIIFGIDERSRSL